MGIQAEVRLFPRPVHAHLRFDLSKLSSKVFDNLNSGGWVEFQETAVDASLEGTALRRWNDRLLEGT
ncbi:methyltransferase domain-containing protein [Colletotrichum tofieldiae]|uniref:Methyltransferase domain-containing protein n=1 Tax=Colletotrichum tofieldiae TaxID=708197 RepID=A0A161Y603_9PEZI|nr:methyltransferase domain-containing protein [Colletotrichum tofieldiae]